MFFLTFRRFATLGQKPLNPELFTLWKQRIMSDSSTKPVQMKHGVRYKFALPPVDLHEEFIKGFGPGGQKTNKSNNCVVLKHLPTGEVVKCHDAREQHANRGIALKLLTERLDLFLNEDTSKVGVRTAKLQKQKEKKLFRQRVKSLGYDENADGEENEETSDKVVTPKYQHVKRKSRR
jgi:protein subunit release factor B